MTVKLDIENFYFWFGDRLGREKITIGGGEVGIHYTIIFKGDRKVVDIHKTIEIQNEKSNYEPILEMRLFTFLRFIVTYKNANLYLLRKFWFAKRINLGKLGHHNMVLFPLTPEDSKASLFIDTKRKKQIKFRKEIGYKPIAEMFLQPSQVLNSNHKSFWVYSTKNGIIKQQGIIFQQDNDIRHRSFYFITSKQFKKFSSESKIAMFNILNRLVFKNKKAVMAYLYGLISKKKNKQIAA